MGSLIKTYPDVIQNWTAVAQNAVAQSAVFDCSAYYSWLMEIGAFLDAVTAHASGTEFIVLGSFVSSGDHNWAEIFRFSDLVSAAAVTQNLTNNPAAAGTTIFTCASTTGFTVAGASAAWRAIKDATLTNSELFLQTAVSSNASVTALDGSTYSHTQNTPMWNTAMSRAILIPFEFSRVKLVVNNNFTSGGATLNYKVRATGITRL